jgi:hypothetical protein
MTSRPAGIPRSPGVDTGARTWTLIGRDGRPYDSPVPGMLGGHRRSRIYGRLDCPGALRWIARGHYERHRVFFADESVAVAAGYRPCAVCLPDAYRRWRVRQTP